MKTATILIAGAVGLFLYSKHKRVVNAPRGLGADSIVTNAPQVPSPAAVIALPSFVSPKMTVSIEPLEFQ